MRSLFFLALGLIAWTVTGNAQTAVTVYGDDNYPPYSFRDRGNIARGTYVRILRAAFEKMPSYDVKIDLVPWRRALAYIEEGTGFAVFPPYYFPERRPYIDPYSQPLLTETVQVICRHTVLDVPREAYPQDYFGLRFGNNSGFETPGPAFFQAVEDGQITLSEAASTLLNIRKLTAGRIDCYVNDRLAIEVGLREEGLTVEEAGLTWGTVVNENDGFLGYAAKADAFPFKADFVQQFDSVIMAMRASGELDDLIE